MLCSITLFKHCTLSSIFLSKQIAKVHLNSQFHSVGGSILFAELNPIIENMNESDGSEEKTSDRPMGLISYQ